MKKKGQLVLTRGMADESFPFLDKENQSHEKKKDYKIIMLYRSKREDWNVQVLPDSMHVI